MSTVRDTPTCEINLAKPVFGDFDSASVTLIVKLRGSR